MQAQLEEEEMEKMRLGAALATLRADMESLSAAHASSAPGRIQTTARTQHVRIFIRHFNIACPCMWNMSAQGCPCLIFD